MIPYITKGDLTKLHHNRQKIICGCEPKCTEFYTFSTEEDFILCTTDAKQFAFELLEELGIVTKKLAFPKSKYGWTMEQERFIQRYFKEEPIFREDGKIKYGTYSMLGEMLGKTREQVKNKIQSMQKEGKL